MGNTLICFVNNEGSFMVHNSGITKHSPDSFVQQKRVCGQVKFPNRENELRKKHKHSTM